MTDQSNRTGPARNKVTEVNPTRVTAQERTQRLIAQYELGNACRWGIETEIKLAEMRAYMQGREDEKVIQEQSRRPEPRYGTP